MLIRMNTVIGDTEGIFIYQVMWLYTPLADKPSNPCMYIYEFSFDFKIKSSKFTVLEAVED